MAHRVTAVVLRISTFQDINLWVMDLGIKMSIHRSIFGTKMLGAID
jgi:hypothetical protein